MPPRSPNFPNRYGALSTLRGSGPFFASRRRSPTGIPFVDWPESHTFWPHGLCRRHFARSWRVRHGTSLSLEAEESRLKSNIVRRASPVAAEASQNVSRWDYLVSLAASNTTMSNTDHHGTRAPHEPWRTDHSESETTARRLLLAELKPHYSRRPYPLSPHSLSSLPPKGASQV